MSDASILDPFGAGGRLATGRSPVISMVNWRASRQYVRVQVEFLLIVQISDILHLIGSFCHVFLAGLFDPLDEL